MKKVLIVDDESLVNKFLETRLSREGFFVVIAPDGQLALTLIRNHRYDVILVDLMVPNIAGRELIMEIQRNELNSQTPIIVLSSLSSDELIVDVLASGVKDYLVKPFSMNVIVANIKQLSQMDMTLN